MAEALTRLITWSRGHVELVGQVLPLIAAMFPCMADIPAWSLLQDPFVVVVTQCM